MTKADLISKFIARIQVGYDLPMHMDMVAKAERLRGIVEMLQAEDEAVLSEMSTIFIKEYSRTTLPTWGHVEAILKTARRNIAERRAQAEYENQQARKTQAHQRSVNFGAIADEIMRSELGRQACEGGWQIGLHDFVAKHGREPDGVERMNLINASKLAERRITSGADEFTQRLISARNQRMANLRAIAFGQEKLHG